MIKRPRLNTHKIIKKGNNHHLTYIDRNGNVELWYGEDAANLTATRWWKSDLFGFRYTIGLDPCDSRRQIRLAALL